MCICFLGSWYSDGLPHEHIKAVGLFCLSSSPDLYNLTLKFREIVQAASDDEDDYDYEIGDNRLEEWAGDGYKFVKGRAYTWKNDLQRKLTDDYRTKIRHKNKYASSESSDVQVQGGQASSKEEVEGVQKLLYFFLVDPEVHLLSTRTVPNQNDLFPKAEVQARRIKVVNDRKCFADDQAELWSSYPSRFGW